MHYQLLLVVNSQLKVKCFLSCIDFALKAQVRLSSVVFFLKSSASWERD